MLIKVALVVSDRPVATPSTFCKRLLTLLAKAQSVRGSCENNKYPEPCCLKSVWSYGRGDGGGTLSNGAHGLEKNLLRQAEGDRK